MRTSAGALCANVLLFRALLTHCVTLIQHPQPVTEIVAKNKFPLKPLEIKCELEDFIIISAPIIATPSRTVYHLYQPNGDEVELDIKPPSSGKYDADIEENVKIKYYRNVKPVMTFPSRYEVFNLNVGKDNYTEKLKDIGPHEYLLGPITGEHNGNWVLSLYYKEQAESPYWIELYQVISIEVIEYIRASPFLVRLRPGKTLILKFPHALGNLESCELIAPKSTIDRFYGRDNIDFQSCRYVVTNVTNVDEGLWTIRATGDINYITKVRLVIKSQASRRKSSNKTKEG